MRDNRVYDNKNKDGEPKEVSDEVKKIVEFRKDKKKLEENLAKVFKEPNPPMVDDVFNNDITLKEGVEELHSQILILQAAVVRLLQEDRLEEAQEVFRQLISLKKFGGSLGTKPNPIVYTRAEREAAYDTITGMLEAHERMLRNRLRFMDVKTRRKLEWELTRDTITRKILGHDFYDPDDVQFRNQWKPTQDQLDQIQKHMSLLHEWYDTEKVLDEHDRRASGIRRYNPWGYSKNYYMYAIQHVLQNRIDQSWLYQPLGNFKNWTQKGFWTGWNTEFDWKRKTNIFFVVGAVSAVFFQRLLKCRYKLKMTDAASMSSSLRRTVFGLPAWIGLGYFAAKLYRGITYGARGYMNDTYGMYKVDELYLNGDLADYHRQWLKQSNVVKIREHDIQQMDETRLRRKELRKKVYW